MTNTTDKELVMHQLIESEASLKEKTITKSQARRIIRSDRGNEFLEVIKEMRAQGRIVDDPEVTYESIVKENWGNGKRVWKQSEIQVLTLDEWNELNAMGEFGINGTARKEGRIFEDIDGSSLLSYKIGSWGNSIPLDRMRVVNQIVRDTEENRAIWKSQREMYNAAKRKNDITLNLLRKSYVPKSEDNRIGLTYINGVLQP